MAQDQMFTQDEVENTEEAGRHRVRERVPLLRRPAPATRATDASDYLDCDDHTEKKHDRDGLNDRKLR